MVFDGLMANSVGPDRRTVQGMPRLGNRSRRRGSCLSPFVLAMLVLAFASVCLAALGFAFWQPTASAGGRMNVLLLGLDRRPEEGSVVRSDVLMLMSVQSAEPQLVLVSIPRDLYVEIPGHGTGRINTAHFWGEQQRAVSYTHLRAHET